VLQIFWAENNDMSPANSEISRLPAVCIHPIRSWTSVRKRKL
jgi:hypothetical protein